MASGQTAIQVAQLLQGCPAGLQFLAPVKELFVYQQKRSGNCTYEVKNADGGLMFSAAEESDCCNRLWLGNFRSFTMNVMDTYSREVITLQKPWRSSLQEIEVQDPTGTTIGYVTQNFSCCVPKYTILNERREPVLKLVGESCNGFASRMSFRVETLDTSSVIGTISKDSTGCLRSVRNYGLEFPVDLDVKIKATLFGACVLIDFTNFEEQAKGPGVIGAALGLIYYFIPRKSAF